MKVINGFICGQHIKFTCNNEEKKHAFPSFSLFFWNSQKNYHENTFTHLNVSHKEYHNSSRFNKNQACTPVFFF